MANRILIDTNVLLDYLITRESYYEEAKEIMLSCLNRETKGCIAAHSIPNIFFILRKDYNVKERREILINLCTIFDVEGIDKSKLLLGLQMKILQILKIAYRWNVQNHMEQSLL